MKLFIWPASFSGYLLAAWEYWRVANWLAPYVKTPWVGEIAGFLIIFFAVLILAGLAGRVARWLMKKAGLSSIDRFLGALLGLLRGALVVAIVLTVMTAFAPAARWLDQSQLAPYFLVGGRAAIWVAPSELRHGLPGAGLLEARAAGIGQQSSEADRAGEVASSKTFLLIWKVQRGVSERSVGSTHSADVQKQYSLLGSSPGIQKAFHCDGAGRKSRQPVQGGARTWHAPQYS